MNKFIKLTIISVFLFLLSFSCNFNTYNLNDGYEIIMNGSKSYLKKNGEVIIENRVVKFAFDDDFILIYRIIDEEDEYYNKNGVYEFYIISKENNKKFGPFNFDRFIEKRKELKINYDLYLEIKV